MKKTFISYTHDSEEYKAKVKNFADFLISNEIDCDLDQYTIFPIEGWTKWMIDRISEANFVLIVCSEKYKTKAEQNTNQASGGTWEGSIVRKDLYSLGNLNRKFIPICFGSENRKFLPNFLSDFTCFDIENQNDLESLLDLIKKDLFTRKPNVDELSKTFELDKIKEIEKTSEKINGNQFLLISPKGVSRILEFNQITYDKNLEINAKISDSSDSSFLQDLKSNRNGIVVTFGLSSHIVNLLECIQKIEQGEENYKLIFEKRDSSKLATLTDIGLEGYTTEEIAEIRVRRILLNKHFLSKDDTDFKKILEDSIFSGVGTPMKASKSPIPEILKNTKSFEEFRISAKLYCVTMLIHSIAITSINNLTFSKEGENIVVDFEGARDKQYTNLKPQLIKFKESVLLN